MIRIKNWNQFQHFKDRRPPWVKLYRDLLDDIEWHELDAEAAKVLVMLWLIASEADGQLPDIKKLSFRLRMSEKDVSRVLPKLSHWLIHDDITVISPCLNDRDDAIPLARSRETEAEKSRGEREGARDDGFEAFWAAYPKRRQRGQAERAWARIRPGPELQARILAAINAAKASKDWLDHDGRYIPHPATWLNGKGWTDDMTSAPGTLFKADWWVVMGYGSKEAALADGAEEPA